MAIRRIRARDAGMGQLLAKLAHQARFADSRFTRNQQNLAFTIARAFPATPQKPSGM
jgi:hypothetical protein